MEIVRALSVVELLSLCVWCVLALLFKLLYTGFVALDGILGRRFSQVLAPSSSEVPRNEVAFGEFSQSRQLDLRAICSHSTF